MSNKAERTNYQRKHRKDIIPRGKCCFPIPKIDRDGGEIDSGAVLWRQQHLNDLSCDGCPSCVLLPAMNILYKVSSHAALLQVKTLPVQFSIDSEQREQAKRKLEQARQFLPNYLIDQLPGGYVRESGMMNDHFGLSGKMVVVDKLLRAISTQQGRVLLFSHSTQALDLIENYVLSMGYSYLRMDGGTSQTKRDQIANQFRTSSTFIFLLSTKAMGLGLNLTQVRCCFAVGFRKCFSSFISSIHNFAHRHI